VNTTDNVLPTKSTLVKIGSEEIEKICCDDPPFVKNLGYELLLVLNSGVDLLKAG